jgi:hypothetical protein
VSTRHQGVFKEGESNERQAVQHRARQIEQFGRNCLANSGLNHGEYRGVLPCACTPIEMRTAPDTST